MFDSSDLIHAYTRANAIEDGFLVDVTTTAKEAGFRYPVALTRAAWAAAVEWTDEVASSSRAIQDEQGRLWDVVWMASLAARSAARRDVGGPVIFSLHVVPANGRSVKPQLLRLRLTIDGGDDGMGAVLISLPDESL